MMIKIKQMKRLIKISGSGECTRRFLKPFCLDNARMHLCGCAVDVLKIAK